jgi:hypothetical protein
MDRVNNSTVGGKKQSAKKSGFQKLYGSRSEVMHSVAKYTSGKLMKKDLKYNKHGRIVSVKMSNRAKKEKRLERAGFKPKPGVFKLFKKSDGKKAKKTAKK